MPDRDSYTLVGKWLLATLAFAVLLFAAPGCNLREFAMDKAVEEQVHYIPDPEHLGGWDFTKITDRVYTFRWTWDRSIVIFTDDGIVVMDPFNREAATILKAQLDKVAPGRPVHTMFYSHYHLDHVPGGAVLKPQNVVAHKKCPEYWADLADEPLVRDILEPTELIEGDQKRVIGGVEIDLLYLGHSHTDTLYAFYLPGEKLLYTVDTGLIRTILPLGGPDLYAPGVLKQMDRLAQLDFDTYVPSHFEYGHKADFLEAVEFAKTLRRLSIETATKYALPGTESAFLEGFHSMYDPLKAKYGHYRGFDQQALFLVSRAFSGALLGY
jgi:glyoxylase-like metal-dependent hydrolase (beta-lactamase superfamily II)